MIVRRSLRSRLGPFPTKAPLEAKVISQEECGAYLREKVEYAVEDGERITAYVLIPKNSQGKAPAVFCHHQHAGNFALGKSEVVGLAGDPDQAYAAELAERGYVAFAPDAIAFEERNGADGDPRVEYYELATRLVKGRTLMAKVLHDVSVGIDYLRERPEVDGSRIGFIGHSYGGRMALWAPAFDKRIKASVSHCGCVNYRNSLTREAGIQMEFCIPGIMEVADVEDVVCLIAPRAVLISATDQDKWSRGAQELYDYAKPAFPGGTLELSLYEGNHVFTPEMRQRAYAFLDKRLSPGVLPKTR